MSESRSSESPEGPAWRWSRSTIRPPTPSPRIYTPRSGTHHVARARRRRPRGSCSSAPTSRSSSPAPTSARWPTTTSAAARSPARSTSSAPASCASSASPSRRSARSRVTPWAAAASWPCARYPLHVPRPGTDRLVGGGLGIVPGGGGTQRLPRLVGRARATRDDDARRRLDADEAGRSASSPRPATGASTRAARAIARPRAGCDAELVAAPDKARINDGYDRDLVAAWRSSVAPRSRRC